MADSVISFYDCCSAGAGTVFTVSASEGASLYRIDQDRLREAVGLIFSVGSRIRHVVRCAAEKMIRGADRVIFPAGRRLIYWICNFRI